VRDGKHADDHPRVRGDEVELLRGTEEEVYVGLQELNEILLSDLFQSLGLIAVAGTQTIPIERAQLPLQDL
jgi:hypothetical protein